MEPSITSALLVYGPLGIMTLVSMLVAAKLYRDRETERAAHRAELEKLQERHVTKAETWMGQYQELAKSLNTVLESISKRYDKT